MPSDNEKLAAYADACSLAEGSYSLNLLVTLSTGEMIINVLIVLAVLVPLRIFSQVNFDMEGK